MKRVLLVLIGMLMLIVGQSVAAKGDDQITISGGNLSQAVQISNNACMLNAFSDTNLEDLTTQFDHAPADLGTNYLITRSTQVSANSYQPFDRLRYYTDPAGGLGYVNYLGMVDTSQVTTYDGKWFHPTAQTDSIINSLIGQPISGTPARVTINSRSLPQVIDVTTDLCTLNALAINSLEDPTMQVSRAPQVTGSGYLITRYVGAQPYDQVRFYRDPQGGYGYVHDLGRVDGSSSPNEGQWFRPTALSEFVMEQILLSPSTYNGSP